MRLLRRCCERRQASIRLTKRLRATYLVDLIGVKDVLSIDWQANTTPKNREFVAMWDWINNTIGIDLSETETTVFWKAFVPGLLKAAA